MSPVLALAGLLVLAPARLVLNAPEGAPPDTALSWRAWSPGQAAQAVPLHRQDLVGAEAPRVLSLRLPGDAGSWTVLVEGEAGGDAWIAVAQGPQATNADLVPIPVPEPEIERAEPAPGAAAPSVATVVLRWSEGPAPSGIVGWQVLRSVGAREPELVGEVRATTSRFVDELSGSALAHEITWSLRPLFHEGVVGPRGRASEPVVLTGPRR